MTITNSLTGPKLDQTSTHRSKNTRQKNKLRQKQVSLTVAADCSRVQSKVNSLPSVFDAHQIYKSSLATTQKNSAAQVTAADIDWDNCRTALLPAVAHLLRRKLPSLIAATGVNADVNEILRWLDTKCLAKGHGVDKNSDTGKILQRPDGKETPYQKCFRKCMQQIAANWPAFKIKQLVTANPHFNLTVKTGQPWVEYKLGGKQYRQPCVAYQLPGHSNNPVDNIAQFIISAVNKLGLQLIALGVAIETNDCAQQDQVCSQFLATATTQQQKIVSCSEKNRDLLFEYRRDLEFYLGTFVSIIKPERKVEILVKYQNYFAKTLTVTSNVSKVLLENKAPAEAIALIDQALELNQISPDSSTNPTFALDITQGLAYCLYNEGLALSIQGKWQESCKYYQQAFDQQPEDFQILSDLLNAATHNKQCELWSSIVDKLPDSHTKTALTLSCQVPLTQNSLEKIASIGSVEEPFCLILSVTKFRAECQKQSVIVPIESEKFDKEIRKLEKDGVPVDTLCGLCDVFGQKALQEKIILTIDCSILQNNPRLQYFRVMQLSRQNVDLLAEIDGYTTEYPQNRALLYYIAAIACSNPDSLEVKLELAISYLKRAVDLDSENQHYNHTRLLTEARLKNDNYQTLIKQHGGEAWLRGLLRPRDPEPKIDEALQILEPKPEELPLWHSYIKADWQKRHDIASTRLAKLSALKTDIHTHTWQAAGQNLFSTSDAIVQLDPYNGRECYGYIDPKTERAIDDSTTFYKFTEALKKAIIRREQGVPGVRILMQDKEWCRMEIKLPGASRRIYGDKFYQNEAGALLVIFNKTANHKATANNLKPMQREAVYSVTQT